MVRRTDKKPSKRGTKGKTPAAPDPTGGSTTEPGQTKERGGNKRGRANDKERVKAPVQPAVQAGSFDPDRPVRQQLDILRDHIAATVTKPVPAPKVTPPQISHAKPKGLSARRPPEPAAGMRVALQAFDDLRADIPLLLLPVRIETRYVSNGSRLRIRVFPDQIGIDSFDPALTPAEVEKGQNCLVAMAEAEAAGEDPAPVWKAFVAGHDQARAVHVLRTLREGVPKTLRDPAQSHVSRAPFLPARWCVNGMAAGEVAFEAVSAPIDRDLALSPDLGDPGVAQRGLEADPALSWMFDFAEAKRRGMALEVSLPGPARERIELLQVFGIVTDDPDRADRALTPARGSAAFNALMQAQHGDWGAGIAAQGAATNNTEGATSGWSGLAPDLDALYAREWLGEVPKIRASRDAALHPAGALSANVGKGAGATLCRALGLADAAAFDRFEAADSAEDAAMAAMNTLLWPVTWGEALDTLMTGREDSYFTPETQAWTRRWFIDTLRGGASLPTLRIGASPYGVLPVQATSTTREFLQSDPDARRRLTLSNLLKRLLADWQSGVAEVIRVPEDPGARIPPSDPLAQPGARLLEVLRGNPDPASFTYHTLVSEQGLFDLRYELRDYLVNPRHKSHALTQIFPSSVGDGTDADVLVLVQQNLGVGADDPQLYTNWPETFRDAEHQLQVLEEKKQFMIDLKTPTSRFYGRGLVEGMLNALITQLVEPQLGHINAVIEGLDYMIDLCVEHREANYALEAVMEPPEEVYSGLVGPESGDAHISYLAHDPRRRAWPGGQLAVTPQGDKTTAPEVYFDYLIAYAQSFVGPATAPPEPAFAGDRAPLLYHLLREAVRRTGVDGDASALLFGALADTSDLTRAGPGDLAGRVRRLEAGEVAELTLGLAALNAAANATGANARVPVDREPLARSLRGIDPGHLGRLSATLKAESTKAAATQKTPADQMSALAAEVGRAREFALGGQALPMGRVPKLRQGEMAEIVAALRLLRDLNGEQLSLLMRQTLGLASWRLDAWITSLAQAQITDLRAAEKTSTGLQIGCYGWVHDLQPAGAAQATPTRSQGFIHTPSLTHAKTAAVLRSGWKTYGSQAADSPMAVNLSSDRMRAAKRAFDAVRQGQDLGDILGAGFEQHLRDVRNGTQWIAPVREAVLDLTQAEADLSHPGVDGLELAAIWADPDRRAGLKTRAFTQQELLGNRPSDREYRLVEDAVEAMLAIEDAMADAAIADSVFSLVQGNYDRAGATMQAISNGSVPPPELEILKSTPPADGMTHRVALFAPAGGGGWVSPDADLWPMAAAEPEAEALAAAVLGPAEDLSARLEARDETGAALGRMSVNWAEMIADGSPLAGGAWDVLALMSEDCFAPGGRLAARLAAFGDVRFRAEGIDPASIAIQPSGAEADMREALLSRGLAWKQVLHSARPLHPRDFIADGTETEGAEVALADLEARADGLVAGFRKAAGRVLGALPDPAPGNPQPHGRRATRTLLAHLGALARFGLHGGVRAHEISQTADAWALAWSMAPNLRARLKAIAGADGGGISGAGAGDVDARLARARSRMQAAAGRRTPGLVSLRLPGLPGIGQHLNQSATRIHRETPTEWIETWGHVRRGLQDLSDALLMQDCLAGPPVPIAVGQWPEAAPQPWIATAPAAGPEGPRMSMVALAPGAGDAPWAGLDRVAGLVVEEIADRIPRPEVDTGVAFHFDAPSSEAPQALLLAVPPTGESWSYELMSQTLEDAFNLARIRPVDGHAMSGLNQLLPAIFGPETLRGGGS